MYLFNLKLYADSLHHAREAYELKPNNADVLRSLIRSHHVMGNIDERYKMLQEMKAVCIQSLSRRIFNG